MPIHNAIILSTNARIIGPCMVVNPIFIGRIVGRIGSRISMTIGFNLGALGTLMQVWVDVNTSFVLTLIGLLLIGLGVTFTIPPLMAAVISSVPKEQISTASGALNSSRQLGATLGVAVHGSILSGRESFIYGMHMSLVVTTAILFGGSLLSFAYIGRRKP